MSRTQRIVRNVLLSLVIVISGGMGFVVKGLNCWNTPMNRCTLNDMGYWPYFFWLVIPACAIFGLAIINKKQFSSKVE